VGPDDQRLLQTGVEESSGKRERKKKREAMDKDENER
jgi:hypothetical protein